MNNVDIRKEIKRNNLYQYQVAAKLGVSECTLIRWLRKELPEEKQAQIMQIIAELEQEAG